MLLAGPNSQAGMRIKTGPDSPLSVRINKLGDALRLIFLGGVICNILMAVWIYTDSRKRGEGSGIFVDHGAAGGNPIRHHLLAGEDRR